MIPMEANLKILMRLSDVQPFAQGHSGSKKAKNRSV